MDTPAFHTLIVSDDQIQSASIKKILADLGMRKVDIVETIVEAIESASLQSPDLAIVNLDVNGRASPDLIGTLVAINPAQKIVMVESEHTVYGPFLGLSRGARGYVSKKDADQSWAEAIKTVLGGEIYLSAESAREIALHAVEEARAPRNPRAILTPRELSLFLRLAAGESIAQAAEAMGLYKSTAANQATAIKKKIKEKATGFSQRAREFWLIPPAPKEAGGKSGKPAKTKRAAT